MNKQEWARLSWCESEKQFLPFRGSSHPLANQSLTNGLIYNMEIDVLKVKPDIYN